MPAIAILLPHRHISTETSTSSNSNFPPPGFKSENAKKPLPKEEQQKVEEKAASEKPDVSIPKDAPTGSPKTIAQEAQSLSELAAQKSAEAKDEKKALEKKDAEKEKVKKTLWQKIKHEAAHYRDGTKLLFTEVRISSKLALKMGAGYELTRREHRQVRHFDCVHHKK